MRCEKIQNKVRIIKELKIRKIPSIQKVLGLLLCFLVGFGLMEGVALATPNTTGWVVLQYKDNDSGMIISSKSISTTLVNGKGKITLAPSDYLIVGYEYKGNKCPPIEVTTANDYDHPVVVPIMLKKVEDIPIIFRDVVSSKGKPDQIFPFGQDVGKVGKPKSGTAPAHNRDSLWISTGGNVSGASGSVTKDLKYTIGKIPEGTKQVICTWTYSMGHNIHPEVTIACTDNFIQGGRSVIPQEFGRDNFDRVDYKYKVDPKGKGARVKSPSMGKYTGKTAGQLKFVKSVYENMQGISQQALDKGISGGGSSFTIPNSYIDGKIATVYAHFYWEWVGPTKDDTHKPPTPTPGGGTAHKIIFTPNDTPWTKDGKTGDGQGGFRVNVSCDDYHPKEVWTKHYTLTKTTTSWTSYWYSGSCDKYGKNCTPGYWGGTTNNTSTTVTKPTSKFKVDYSLSPIQVAGTGELTNMSYTVSGETGGDVDLEQNKTGHMDGEASYSIRTKETPIPPAVPSNTSSGNSHNGSNTTYSQVENEEEKPKNCIADSPRVEGTSGEYFIDYTKPNIAISNSAPSSWINTSGYSTDVSTDDLVQGIELSGVDSVSTTVTDSSHYNRNQSLSGDTTME